MKKYNEDGIVVIELIGTEGEVETYDLNNLLDIFCRCAGEQLYFDDVKKTFDEFWEGDTVRTLDDFYKMAKEEAFKLENVRKFLTEYEELCKKYNFSLSHQDGHGSFIIEHYSQSNIDWVKDAAK